MSEKRHIRDDLAGASQLLVVRDKAGATTPDDVEIFVIVHGDGRVTAFNGHVDLGTGIGTALGPDRGGGVGRRLRPA